MSISASFFQNSTIMFKISSSFPFPSSTVPVLEIANSYVVSSAFFHIIYFV